MTEIKPTRNSVRAVYSVEDDARLPGLADAIMRDLRAAMVEKIDRTIFVGDDGASEATADIAGLTTATGVAETTLTQAQKVAPADVLGALAAFIDGKHAGSMADVRLVASVGANTLWLSTIAAVGTSLQTLAAFLRENGVEWVTRGEISTTTTASTFAGFVGLGRGISGAGIAPVWNSGQLSRGLIVDPYTGSAKGETALTLQFLWGFKLARPSSFRRIKHVA